MDIFAIAAAYSFTLIGAGIGLTAAQFHPLGESDDEADRSTRKADRVPEDRC